MAAGYSWQRRRRNPLVPIAVGAVGLLVIVLAQDIPNRHSIEDDLTGRSVRALRSAGLSDVDVSFTGRDGTLRARSRADGDRALAIVRSQNAVRVARVEVTAPPPVMNPAVNLAVDGGQVVLTGRVPTEAARTALVDGATATFGADAVADRLTVDAGVGDAGLGGLPAVLGALGKEAKGAAIDLRDGAITLTGTVPSQTVKDAAVQAAGRASAAVVDRLQVAVPDQVQNELTELSATVTFENNSATLTAEGQATVAKVADTLRANPNARIGIEGHTDDRGSPERNQRLSGERAQAVLNTLVSLGVAADRLTATGFGSSRPKAPNDSDANRAINRRVEFVVQR